MALITPIDFQNLALVWIGVATIVISAAVTALSQVWAKVEVLFRLHAQNDAKINDNAMATPTAPTLNITAGTGQTPPAGDVNDATN